MQADAVIIFDGSCGFCQFVVSALAERLRLPAERRPWQSLNLAEIGLTPEQVRKQIWYVSGETRRGGCSAFAAWLQTGGWASRLLGKVLQLPVIAQLGQLVYRLVAARRHQIPGPWQHSCQIGRPGL